MSLSRPLSACRRTIPVRLSPAILLLVFCLLSGLACFRPAMAKDEITWLEADAPPFFIEHGPDKGQGYEDVITAIIQHDMPDYVHHRLTATISRHYHDFKTGKKVCSVGLYKTPEREKFLYFSIPSFFTLPTVIIIKKDRFADFGNSKTVSLEKVLQKKDLLIGRAQNRSYGRYVDEILDRHKGAGNIFVYEGEQLSLNFFRMLQMDRLDGVIGLPEEAMYLAEKLGIRDRIMTLTIRENQRGMESWLSYAACSRTPWGKKVIARINEVLLKERPTERYRAAYERWLDPSSLENYRKLYRRVFLKLTSQAPARLPLTRP